MSVDWFDAPDAERARRELLACRAHAGWAGGCVAGRPYRDAAALLRVRRLVDG